MVRGVCCNQHLALLARRMGRDCRDLHLQACARRLPLLQRSVGSSPGKALELAVERKAGGVNNFLATPPHFTFAWHAVAFASACSRRAESMPPDRLGSANNVVQPRSAD